MATLIRPKRLAFADLRRSARRHDSGRLPPARSRAVLPEVALSRRDILVTASADGSVLPLDSTEVKSKASGEVTAILVQTGDVVRRGQLLVRIDPRNLRNAVTQAQADVDAAQVQLQTAQSAARRAEIPYQSKSIAEQDYESAQLQVADAKDALARWNRSSSA